MPCSNVLVVVLFIVGFTDVIVIEGKSILELRVIQRTISAVWYNIKSIQRVNNDWSSETLKSSFFKIWVGLRRAMPHSKWWQHTGFVQCSNSSGRQGSIWLVYWTSVLVEVTGCCVLEEDTLLSQYLSPDKIVIGFQRFVTVTWQNTGITCNGIAYHSRWASNIPWVANRNLNLSAGTIKPPRISLTLFIRISSQKRLKSTDSFPFKFNVLQVLSSVTFVTPGKDLVKRTLCKEQGYKRVAVGSISARSIGWSSPMEQQHKLWEAATGIATDLPWSGHLADTRKLPTVNYVATATCATHIWLILAVDHPLRWLLTYCGSPYWLP